MSRDGKKTIKKLGVLLGRPWLQAWILSLVSSLVLFQIKKAVASFSLGFFLQSALISFCFWAFFGRLDSLLRRVPRIILSLLVGSLYALLITASVFIYLTFRSFITSDLLMIIDTAPSYILQLAKSYLFHVNGLILVILAAFFSMVWFRQGRRAVSRLTLKKAVILGLLVLVIVGGVLRIRSSYADFRVPLDTSFLAASFETLLSANRETLHASLERIRLTPADQPSPVNIILIITESFGRFGVPGYDDDSRAMPFLSSWIEREKDRFISFRRFYSNASLSVISLPSLLTGVPPFESSRKLHQAPLLWDWARAAGCQTAIVSSQHFNWGGFRGFFLHPGPDYQITGETIDLPTVNDIGVDDLAAFEYLRGFVKRVPKERSFLAVYYSSALHAPFQQASRHLDAQPRFEIPYQNALFITDKLFENLAQTLQGKGVLDKTVLIITADHAEYPLRKDVPRVLSYYEEVLRIPCLIRLPESWEKDHAEAARILRSNADRLASNIDLLPTIVAMMGADRTNGPLFGQLEGTSLCRPLPDRFVVAMNTNEIRGADQEGFGLYWPGKSFLFSTIDGPKYFDLDADPGQDRNQWNDVRPETKSEILAIIDKTDELRRIYRKWLKK